VGDSHGGDPVLRRPGFSRWSRRRAASPCGRGLVGGASAFPPLVQAAERLSAGEIWWRVTVGWRWWGSEGVGVGDSRGPDLLRSAFTTMGVRRGQGTEFLHGEGSSELPSFLARRRCPRRRRRGYVFSHHLILGRINLCGCGFLLFYFLFFLASITVWWWICLLLVHRGEVN
jgi:hypothetical protein